MRTEQAGRAAGRLGGVTPGPGLRAAPAPADRLLTQADPAVRAAALLGLAETLVTAHPLVPLTAVQVRQLDRQLPGLLASSYREAAAAAAVCAALADRLGPQVRPALHDLARSTDPRLAVAGHLAGLLAAGMPVSEQHLLDLGAVAGVGPLARGGSVLGTALAFVLELARDVVRRPTPAARAS